MTGKVKANTNIIKKLLLISLVLPISGCINLGAAYPTGPKTYVEKERNDYDFGVANHTGKDIYIESLKLDHMVLVNAVGYRYCLELMNVNSLGHVVSLDRGTRLPDNKIEVVWDSLTPKQVKKAVLKIPETEFINNFVEQHKGNAYLYVDIREGGNVWLRLANTENRIENINDVFVIAKSKAKDIERKEKVNSRKIKAKDASIKYGRKYRLSLIKGKAKQVARAKRLRKEIEKSKSSDLGKNSSLEKKVTELELTESFIAIFERKECWSEEEKINYISKNLRVPKDRVLFDRWYPGAPENKEKTNE